MVHLLPLHGCIQHFNISTLPICFLAHVLLHRPKIKTPPGGVRNVDLFESDCHDIEAWKICAEVETTRLAKDPAAAKTAKHPCEFCDNKELCSITEALVVLSAPHFAGASECNQTPAVPEPSCASLWKGSEGGRGGGGGMMLNAGYLVECNTKPVQNLK